MYCELLKLDRVYDTFLFSKPIRNLKSSWIFVSIFERIFEHGRKKRPVCRWLTYCKNALRDCRKPTAVVSWLGLSQPPRVLCCNGILLCTLSRAAPPFACLKNDRKLQWNISTATSCGTSFLAWPLTCVLQRGPLRVNAWQLAVVAATRKRLTSDFF